MSTSSATAIPRTGRASGATCMVEEYLGNWRSVRQTPIELTARALASHVLDLVYGADHLHRWISAVGPDAPSIADLAQRTTKWSIVWPSVAIDCSFPALFPTRNRRPRVGQLGGWTVRRQLGASTRTPQATQANATLAVSSSRCKAGTRGRPSRPPTESSRGQMLRADRRRRSAATRPCSRRSSRGCPRRR